MIKPTYSAWLSSLVQQARADLLVADSTKELEAAGFRRVEGTPDVWEYHGTREEAEAITDRVLGKGKVKGWWNPWPGLVYKADTPLWPIIEDGWSRGFYPYQTLAEARAQGYVVTLEWIQAHWDRMTREMYELEARLSSGPEV